MAKMSRDQSNSIGCVIGMGCLALVGYGLFIVVALIGKALGLIH